MDNIILCPWIELFVISLACFSFLEAHLSSFEQDSRFCSFLGVVPFWFWGRPILGHAYSKCPKRGSIKGLL